MGIFDSKIYLNPKYNHLDRYVKIMYKGFWTPSKYKQKLKEADVPYIKNAMSEKDKEAIKRCIMTIAMVEDRVKVYWGSLVSDIPQTVVGDVGGAFNMSEVTHRRSYHALVEQLGIDLTGVEKYPLLVKRIKYLQKYLEKDPKVIGKKRVLKKLVLFTSLVERCSLFTQFYILMSYDYHKKGLSTISALQQSTAIEEDLHYNFGIDIINIIKEEYPQLWDSYLTELIYKNIKMAYTTEKQLINWFFEKGVPDHITKEEVLNFLNYNFSRVSEDLGLKNNFKYDKDLFENKNKWFILKTKSKTEPDFFDRVVGDYSSEDKEVNINDINF